MRVLVTGHLGYIGCCLLPKLKAKGFDVVGCDSELFAGCDYGPLPTLPANLGIDIRDISTRDLKNFDAIIHLAGLSNDPLGELDPALTREINELATVELARKARAAGVQRFLFSSSCSNYGAAPDQFVDEDSPLNPLAAYGNSKVRAEQGLNALACDEFSPVHLRNATAYGYSPRIRFDLVVNNLLAWAHTTGRVLLKSQGLAWRPLVHVDDIAAAFVAVLETPREQWHKRAFNIGDTQQNFQVKDVAAMVARQVPGAELDMLPGAQADQRDYRVNCDRVRRELSAWTPAWTVEQGIEELHAAYQEFGLAQDEFEDSRYQRLARLQRQLAEGSLDSSLRRQDSTLQPLC